MGMKSWLMAVLPFAGMVSLQFLEVGLTTLGKAAMSRGMSHYVFVVYSNALGTLLLLPFFLFNRKGRPPLTYSILFKFFILSLLGITVMQNCLMTAVNYSSPVLGSAMSQLIPAFTFLLAVILRMEKLDLGSSKSQIKIISTIVLISGALIMILYKGAPIIALDIQSSQQELLPSISSAEMNNWVLGGFLFAVACLSISINTTGQAVVLKDYPSQTTLVTFYCFFGTIQCVIVSLIAERNPNAWKLTHNIEFISVIYSAVCGTVVTSSMATWCIRKKGPVFVAMFTPVGIAISAILGVIFLGETLYVGRIIGAVIIVVGFYGVVRSQSKEEEESRILRVEGSRLSSQRSPLLENRMDV